MASEGGPISLANANPDDGSKSNKSIAIYDVRLDATPDVDSMGEESTIDALMMPIRRHPKPTVRRT